MHNKDIIIIGGGLTGLALAYFLRQSGKSILVIEARNRLGGRILTKYQTGMASLEMGATWLGMKHTALVSLLKELGLDIFEQRMGKYAIYEPMSINPPQIAALPSNPDPSYRIAGGTYELIQRLTGSLTNTSVQLSEAVKKISYEKGEVHLTTNRGEYLAKQVVSTLPPYLLHKTVQIEPALPKAFSEIAKVTHTWMGESIKVGLTYQKPFWREGHSSGTIFSNVGPVPEMYDHSNYQDKAFALKGFLNGAFHCLTKQERLEAILKQLQKYYGKSALDYTWYEELVWRHEHYTFRQYDESIIPHQNNGHAIFRQPFFDENFFIAGSETAPHFPGYMEGAVQSAKFVREQLRSI